MDELSEGVYVEEIEEKVYETFQQNVPTYVRKGFVRMQPYNQIMPKCFLRYEKMIKSFPIRQDDIWIASFPKCGTTWTQEMVWCIRNNVNLKQAKEVKLDERVPYFELSEITDQFSGQQQLVVGSMEKVSDMQSPRIIKTHLSWQMLPNELKMTNMGKVIYVTRNPRDTCVSYYNHWKLLEGYKGSFDDFAIAFINDVAGYYSPFIHHVLEYWKVSQRPDVCFITYEDMKMDLCGVIKKVGNFLGCSVDEKDIPALVNHLSFDKMKNNPAVNKEDFVKAMQDTMSEKYVGGTFMRKGQSGDWKNYFSPELSKLFQDWEDKWLKDSDFKFQYLN